MSVPAAAVGLGNIKRTCNPPPSNHARYQLQTHAQDLLPNQSVSYCCRALLKHETTVNVVQHSSGSLSYGNLVKCGSVWVCPICSAKIVARRREELSNIIDAAYSAGFVVSMLTLTVPHQHDDNLAETLQRISKAKRLMQNRKFWKRFSLEIGLVGDVRTLEVTHGVNGWHPHFHCLLFHKPTCTNKGIFVAHYMPLILEAWQLACLTAGLSCPNEHGVNLIQCEKRTSKDLGNYIAKFGVDFEMTMGAHNKTISKNKGRSPFLLLADSMSGDSYAGHLFQVYAKAFKSKRQLVFSRGLKALFSLAESKTDEEIVLDNDSTVVVYSIAVPLWNKIVSSNLRGAFLDFLRVRLVDPSCSVTALFASIFQPLQSD